MSVPCSLEFEDLVSAMERVWDNVENVDTLQNELDEHDLFIPLECKGSIPSEDPACTEAYEQSSELRKQLDLAEKLLEAAQQTAANRLSDLIGCVGKHLSDGEADGVGTTGG